MPLMQDAEDPALWVDPDWTGTTPGTFGVVIGVSAYPHLNGTEATLGLGQLTVSALTAFRFFRWLCTSYRYGEAPLVRCWLLLAPTAAELEYGEQRDPLFYNTLQRTCSPTLEACTRAIREWDELGGELHPDVAERSRMIFFFSGHGIEQHVRNPILLPCDFWKQGRYPNDSISVRNLGEGLADNPIPDQFFFLDACRMGHERLQKFSDVRGADILSSTLSDRSNWKRSAPVVYASTSGTEAWSPDDPHKGISIFGRALLEGLSAALPPLLVHCDDSGCEVRTNALIDFVRVRVQQLLGQAWAGVQQYIADGGWTIKDLGVTQVAGPPSAQTADDSEPPRLHGATYEFQAGWNPHEAHFRGPVGRIEMDGREADDAAPDPHQVFGSDRLALAWRSSAIYAYGREVWLQRPDDYLLHRVWRDSQSRSAAAVLSIPEARGDSWLQLDDHGMRFASLVPEGAAGAKYLVQTFLHGDGPVVGMEVELDRGTRGVLGLAARLWFEYRRGSLQRAGDLAEELRSFYWPGSVRPSPESALTEVIAEMVRLYAGPREPAAIPEWWNSVRPDDPLAADIAVLRFERQVRTEEGPTVQDLRMLAERLAFGIPRLGPLAALLASRTSWILRLLGEDGTEDRPGLAGQVGEWARHLHGSGLFTTFAGPADDIHPWLATGRSRHG